VQLHSADWAASRMLNVEISAPSLGAGSGFGIGSQIPVATIALLVTGRDRSIFAIATAQPLARPPDSDLLDSSCWKFGTPVDAAAPQGTAAQQLLDLVRLHQDTYVHSSVGRFPAQPPRRCEASLGRPVWQVSERGCYRAVVKSVRSAFVFQSPDKPPQIVTDAFELVAEETAAFEDPAASGSLIVAEDGAPIGVLVAKGDDRLFAVPLLPWLQDRRMSPLTRDQERRHNRNIRCRAFAHSLQEVDALSAVEAYQPDYSARLAEIALNLGPKLSRRPLPDSEPAPALIALAERV
jgi:hypothetical protein